MALGKSIVFSLYIFLIFFLSFSDTEVTIFENLNTNFSRNLVNKTIKKLAYFFLISDSIPCEIQKKNYKKTIKYPTCTF